MATIPVPEEAAPVERGLRRKLRALLHGDSRPGALALAVALGIFLGCSPLYGFQTLLALALAALFRLNPFAALLGSQVSFPPLGLGLTLAEVATGEWLRFGRLAVPPTVATRELTHWLWGHALLSWALGSLLVGGALAALGGLATFGILSYYRAVRSRGGAPG